MDSAEGRFHEVEKDGELLQLVYYHPKYSFISETQCLTSSIQNNIFQPLFLCPNARLFKIQPNDDPNFYPVSYSPIISSPRYPPSTLIFEKHHVLPLFWCNNRELDEDGECSICKGSKYGTDYYFCEICCYKQYHKECVQSPSKIRHPYHPEHSLQLYFYPSGLKKNDCYFCRRKAEYLVYCCTTCDIFMHPICAMKSIPFVTEPPKRHVHPLTFFPRQNSLTCNVCGLLEKGSPTYICARCNFVTHTDCMYSPHIIKISRHPHRISYNFSLLPKGWSCGVCHKITDGDFGAYACDKCVNYVVHSRCALGKDVWDGQDLKDVPDEDDITQDGRPYNVMSKGVIFYFLHDHQLLLHINIIFDENKFCQACVIPIYEGNLYSCNKCDFILHETCANASRRIYHALHPHPLTLKSVCRYDIGAFICNACGRVCGGFVYDCRKGKCDFNLDVRCALIDEPFNYNGHNHPLFLGLDQAKNPICQICKIECVKYLTCIYRDNCNFIICIKCATIPYKIRYKHDKHFLTFSSENEVREKDCCEVCECSLRDSSAKGFYWCKECSTTLHIDCLFSDDSYLKAGRYVLYDMDVEIQRKIKHSRPICEACEKYCQSTIFVTKYGIACSMKCCEYIW